MPALPVREETFCQLLISGVNAKESYIRAGYKSKNDHVARVSACTLKKKQKILDRLEEIRGENQARIAQEVNQAIASVGPLDADVFSRLGRAKELAKRRAKLLEIVEARSKDAEHLAVPGGSTGYVLVGWKQVGGDKVRTVTDNIALHAELRATEEQIARELGQWVEKHDDTMTVKSLADLPDEAVQEIIKQAELVAAQEGIELQTIQ